MLLSSQTIKKINILLFDYRNKIEFPNRTQNVFNLFIQQRWLQENQFGNPLQDCGISDGHP